MFARIDIRKSALTFLGAAALSLAGMLASAVHASPLAATAHRAGAALSPRAEYGSHERAISAHRLTRPANRFQGFAGEPGLRPAR